MPVTNDCMPQRGASHTFR